MTRAYNEQAILMQNPQIRAERVAEYLAYERDVSALSGQLQPRYELVQPLGRTVAENVGQLACTIRHKQDRPSVIR